ncbi:hypothetical protein BH587_02805 [Pseudomonas aeruginosa]|nr:hypothetical protein BH587_02805 [Pseudomonas aeruginosa]
MPRKSVMDILDPSVMNADELQEAVREPISGARLGATEEQERAEKVVVTKAMLDVGYEILDEYLSYNDGLISRGILEEAFRAMCLCWLQESAVESGCL